VACIRLLPIATNLLDHITQGQYTQQKREF
jgi:hypothetical protein